jgi:hypothetical protein
MMANLVITKIKSFYAVVGQVTNSTYHTNATVEGCKEWLQYVNDGITNERYCDDIEEQNKEKETKKNKGEIEMMSNEFCSMLRRTNRFVFMNAPIITSEGSFKYEKLDLNDLIQTILYTNNFEFCSFLSAIGHEGTAQLLTEIINSYESGEIFFSFAKEDFPERKIPLNRIVYTQEKNDMSIVLKVRGRIPEGTVLDKQTLEKIGYDFYALYMI